MKIIHQKDLKQITFLDERFYFNKKSGKYQAGVTTYLNIYPKGFGFEQYLKDVGSNADEVLKRAQEQGTNIHNAIDQLIKGEKLEWITKEKENYTLVEWLMILKFVDFYKTYKPKVIASEISMVSDKLEFGGTLDLVCKINKDNYKDVWYIDYKSGKAIWKTNKIQGAAYKEIWNSQRKEQITKVGCMHLRALTRGPDKTGKKIQGKGWKVDEVENPDHLFRLFKHTQAIWKEENPNPKPKNMVYPDRISIKKLKKQEKSGVK